MDYKSLHLKWLNKTPSFVPKFANQFSEPYYEIISELYRRPFITNDIARQFFAADMRWHSASDAHILQLQKINSKGTPMSPLFITIGFNHQTWNIPGCVKVIQNIIQFEWIASIYAVFEYHRQNGVHPHAHMIIIPAISLSKSKVLEKLWAAGGIKKVVLNNNYNQCSTFVDYKIAEDYHYKYIKGEKQESKMPFVLKDIQWRKENNIDDFFSKNYNL